MQPISCLAAVSAFVLAAGAATAQTQNNPVGVWTGTVRFVDAAKPRELGRDSGDKTKYTLVFRADKTFTRKVKTPDGKANESSGLWTLSGGEIRLTVMKVNGKRIQRPGVSRLVLGADGKTLRLRVGLAKGKAKVLPQPGESVQVVFSPST